MLTAIKDFVFGYDHPEYLSYHQLGITKQERLLLIQVLDFFKNGHASYVNSREPESRERGYGDNYFNMTNFSQVIETGSLDTDKCDTFHCIGGFMKMFDFRYITSQCSNPMSLLFYPSSLIGEPHLDVDMNDINIKSAISAIENFLTFGSPGWIEVLNKNQPEIL